VEPGRDQNLPNEDDRPRPLALTPQISARLPGRTLCGVPHSSKPVKDRTTPYRSYPGVRPVEVVRFTTSNAVQVW
jgi:hypothetical protein